ncbi:AAA-ATPase 1, putative [Theobroma cacao]|uniref:AAA-ATPase 1, putative n=1 Tax=Theobroma cacao TaxID=3641 RepID=A0A061F1U8_THECC|nr:AAA-ATPase 1, putative [Theobroma cacao]
MVVTYLQASFQLKHSNSVAQERLKNYFFPSIRITFDEFTSGLYHRSDAYIAIEYTLAPNLLHEQPGLETRLSVIWSSTKIGKAWKRGYLLYGPPGTGKSTLILVMSNLLSYDIHDLELITIKDNAYLKTLLINSSRKGIFVVEDIDCSFDITQKQEK